MRKTRRGPGVCDIIRRGHGDSGIATTLRVTCCSCPAHEEQPAGYGKRESKDIVAIFERKGWKHRSKMKWTCPACLADNAAARSGDKPTVIPPGDRKVVSLRPPSQSPVATKESTVPRKQTVPPTVPPSLSPKDLRRVMAAIEERWLDDDHLYADGWSDEKIARELDLPRAAVAKAREEYFGNLAEDPELAALRGEIEKAVTFLGALEARLAKIEQQRQRFGG